MQRSLGIGCCQSRCVSNSPCTTLTPGNCVVAVIHCIFTHSAHEKNMLFALRCLQYPTTFDTVKNGCSKFTGSVNLFVTLSVLGNSLLNPGRNETLFVGAGCLNVSQNGAAPRSICIAAIDSDLILTDVATLMSDCTSH